MKKAAIIIAGCLFSAASFTPSGAEDQLELQKDKQVVDDKWKLLVKEIDPNCPEMDCPEPFGEKGE